MDKWNKKIIIVLYFFIFFTCMLPLTCNFILSGGIIEEYLPLFQKAGNTVLAYQGVMIVIHGISFLGCLLGFKLLPNKKEVVFWLTLLYMLSPYRMYLCYDLGNISGSLAFAFLPFSMFGLYGIIKEKKNIIWCIVLGISLAFMGYADAMIYVITNGIILLAILVWRKWQIVMGMTIGACLYAPKLLELYRYIFIDTFDHLSLPLNGIMEKGYSVGEWFTSFVYGEGHPGMGLAILLGVIIFIWISFVENVKLKGLEVRFCLGMTFLFLIMSLRNFPIDLLQRMGVWSLKMISFIETPSIFFGFAIFFLSVVGAIGLFEISNLEGRKESRKVVYGIKLSVVMAAFGVAIYLINTWNYGRYPLQL